MKRREFITLPLLGDAAGCVAARTEAPQPAQEVKRSDSERNE
jgi:hypothetical protein